MRFAPSLSSIFNFLFKSNPPAKKINTVWHYDHINLFQSGQCRYKARWEQRQCRWTYWYVLPHCLLLCALSSMQWNDLWPLWVDTVDHRSGYRATVIGPLPIISLWPITFLIVFFHNVTRASTVSLWWRYVAGEVIMYHGCLLWCHHGFIYYSTWSENELTCMDYDYFL